MFALSTDLRLPSRATLFESLILAFYRFLECILNWACFPWALSTDLKDLVFVLLKYEVAWRRNFFSAWHCYGMVFLYCSWYVSGPLFRFLSGDSSKSSSNNFPVWSSYGSSWVVSGLRLLKSLVPLWFEIDSLEARWSTERMDWSTKVRIAFSSSLEIPYS